MIPLSELRALGVSSPILALALGFGMGWAACYTLKNEQMQSLRGEISLVRKQANDAQQSHEHQCTEQTKVAQAQCERSNLLLSEQTQQIQQISDWNTEWRKNYAALESNCRTVVASHSLAKELKDAREQWDHASGEVIRYTSGHCNPQANDCDLIPLAQRKLKALEARRDQLQSQVIDLQSRISCGSGQR